MKMGLPMILDGVLMFGLMIGLMVTPAQLMSGMGGMGFGMWGVMLIPVVVMAAMMVGMAFLYRRMTGGKGMPAMMVGHDHIHAQISQGTKVVGTNLTFNVPSVNCGNCKMTIEQAVAEIQGVTSVNVDVEAKQAKVNFNAPATQAEIEAVLTEIGHPPALQN
jgi:copper chaperone CopZ